MANCDDLNSQLKAIDDELEAIESTQRGLQARGDLLTPQPKGKPRILRTFTGQQVGVDPGEWVTQVELDAMRMGDEGVRRMVQAGFEGRMGPNGRTGRMVNYAMIDPSEENVAVLLEHMGYQRAETEAGLELRRPFTSQSAMRALMDLAQQAGADPRAVAEALSRRTKNIRSLPATVYSVAKARWDSASQYADALDELADAVETGFATPEMQKMAGNAAKWAHYYENLDAMVRRKVGQSLRSLQFKADEEFKLFDVGKDIEFLKLDGVTGDSVVAEMMKLTKEGNAKALRRLATAKRLEQMTGARVNQPGFFADMRLLNTFRRANLLSSASTWLVRNPVSGALIQGTYMAEDAVSGTFRLVAKNGLKAGVADGLQATGHAARAFNSAWSMAWSNMSESLQTGRAVMGDGSPKYVSAAINESTKEFVDRALSVSWDNLASARGVVNPVNWLNVTNAAFWKVFGGATERLTGSDAGYMFPFRLLSGADEFVRTQAFAWKVNHEAFIRAAEEGRAAGKPVQWIEQRAEELARDTIFDGVMTDDQLAQFRRARNEQFGMPAGDEIPDDELRAMLYEQYHNVPNPGNELTGVGLGRGDDVTLTGQLENPVLAGIQRARENPLISWLIPFWRVPVNGISWVLNRDLFVALPKQLVMETWNLRSRQKFGAEGARWTPEQMADARARTVVAATISGITHMLWESGLFTDGGSFDPRQRERERRNWVPYSFTLGVTQAGAGVFARASGIDVIDLMGLQADLSRAWHDGLIKQGDYGAAMRGMVLAYAQMLQNRAALKNITTILDWAQDPDRYDTRRILGDQLGGILPLSGFFAHGVRGFSDPELKAAKRRRPTAEEMALVKRDPVFGTIEPILDMLESATTAAFGNYPVINELQPRERDWLGNRIERPLGLPLDLAVPFMPVLKPQDRLYQWLEKHGFGDKPNPEGTFEYEGTKVQMTNEEENYYREGMRSIRGSYTPQELSVSSGRLFPIEPFVRGRNMQEALRALMNDPEYNRLLNDPTGGVSPSLTVQPGRPLSGRLNRGGKELYYPIDDIIEYYNRAAVLELLKNDKFGFKDRFLGVARNRQRALQDYLEQNTPLGVGRQ